MRFLFALVRKVLLSAHSFKPKLCYRRNTSTDVTGKADPGLTSPKCPSEKYGLSQGRTRNLALRTGDQLRQSRPKGSTVGNAGAQQRASVAFKEGKN